MTLRLSNNSLTRYVQRSGYAAAEPVPLVGALGEVAASLLAWLGAQLATGETLADVVLEASGQVAAAYETQTDEDGNEVQVPTAYRPTISAAVSVTAPLGSRTFVVSSESLPSELRDGLVAAWASLNSEPLVS
jgi:threonine/homoserine/homoserine lactone efflux protein